MCLQRRAHKDHSVTELLCFLHFMKSTVIVTRKAAGTVTYFTESSTILRLHKGGVTYVDKVFYCDSLSDVIGHLVYRSVLTLREASGKLLSHGETKL